MKIKDNDIMILVEVFPNSAPGMTNYKTFGYIHNNPLNKNSKLFIEFPSIYSNGYIDIYKTSFLNRVLDNKERDYKGKVLIRWEK